jgi:hypothetical protein
MTALGHERAFADVCVISALPPKADIAEHGRHVRLVPKADVAKLADLLGSRNQISGID